MIKFQTFSRQGDEITFSKFLKKKEGCIEVELDCTVEVIGNNVDALERFVTMTTAQARQISNRN